jgi:hypothetical protein
MPSDEIRAEHCAISEVEFEQGRDRPHLVHADIFRTSIVRTCLIETWVLGFFVQGFEGDRDPNGQRNRLGGWRAAGLPWAQS